MFQHETLAGGRWGTMTLAEQLGNIGSEISRMIRAEGRDQGRFDGAFWRALELFDLTLSDARWRGRYREIARAREVLCDLVAGDNQYRTTLADLLRYFDWFAYRARASLR